MTKEQAALLEMYKDTGEGNFMQGLPGATELMALGYLQFRGEQYGSPLFSITDTGLRALRNYWAMTY